MSMYFYSHTQLLASDKYSEYVTRMSQKYITYVYLAARIYDEGSSTVGNSSNILGETWRLEYYISEKNGFQAGLYYNKYDDKYIVSFGGTTANPKELKTIQKIGGSLLDLGTDLTLLSNLYPATQSESALNFIEKVENRFNIKVDAIVGHSLGGGLAAYSGLYYNIPTYTLNSAPIPFTWKKSLEKFYLNHAIKTPTKIKWGKETRIEFVHADKITNIMSNDDLMTRFNFYLKKLDDKHFHSKNPITPLNSLKLAMLIPIQLRLDYIFVGKNIKLSTDTGHSSVAFLNTMKDAVNRAIIKGKLISYELYNKLFFLAEHDVSTVFKLQDNYNSYNDFNPKKAIKTEHFINMVIEAYNRTHLYDTKLTANIFFPLLDKLYEQGSSTKFKETILLKDAVAVMYYLFDKSYGSRFQEGKVYARNNHFGFTKKYFIYFLKYLKKDIKNRYESFYYTKTKKMYLIYGGTLFRNSNELNYKLTKEKAVRLLYNYMKYHSIRNKGE